MRRVKDILAMDKATFYVEVAAPWLCKLGRHSYAAPHKVSRLYGSFDFLFWSVAEQFGLQRCQRPGCTHERTVRRTGVAGPDGEAGRWSPVKLAPGEKIEWFSPKDEA